MIDGRDMPQGKTPGDLARETMLFLVHTLIAVFLLAVAVGAMSLNNPDPDSPMPKLIGTLLAFLVPLIASFLLARVHRNAAASHVWITGLVLFSFVCVWVLGLPTGRGLCESCSASEKIWRTFFTFNKGSGLMGGDGLLIGTWMPLSMIGYAIGAKFAL